MKRTGVMSQYYKFLMYLAVIVLLNIAGITLFFRMDLTANKVYSLSDISKKAVATLSEPLTIKVFFNANLPAPYNNIERYLRDLLEEYAIAGNRFFNYQFYNVSNKDDEESRRNQELARNYGIQRIQIRMIEHDEVKFQKAFMGMVLIHGDIIETLPTITSTERLEYQITSAIRRMNNKISALLRLQEKIAVKLFLSSSLQVVGPYMNLTGLLELPGKIENLVDKLNGKNYGKLSFSYFDPSVDQAYEQEAKDNNILQLRWKEFIDRQGKTIQAGRGYAGIIMEHGKNRENIRLIKVVRIPILGNQYRLADLNELEKTIDETVGNVIDINEEIGYLADHGSHALEGRRSMPGQIQPKPLTNFNKLLAEGYSIKYVNLKEGGIPEGLSSMIVAGAKEPFSDYELYQIDQFLMKGKNLAIFMDSFNEIIPNNQPGITGQYQRPVYMPINTGLEKMLMHYGLGVKKSFILDENCFKQQMRQPFGGERPIYYAPIVKNERINKQVAFLKNIKGLVMLKTSPVKVNEQRVKEYGLKAHKLLSSSNRSWEMSGRINLDLMFMNPPQNDNKFKSMAMAYILEGSFPSYFADKPVPVKEGPNDKKDDTGESKTEESKEESGIDMAHFTAESTTIKKGKPGKILLVGTSEILRDNILDKDGISPNAQFVMNVIDYLNNREDNAIMRSKTLHFNPLREVRPATRTLIKTANIAGVPMLIIFTGLIVWVRRLSRKRTIQEIFRK